MQPLGRKYRHLQLQKVRSKQMLGACDSKLRQSSKLCSALDVWRNVLSDHQVCGDTCDMKVNTSKALM